MTEAIKSAPVDGQSAATMGGIATGDYTPNSPNGKTNLVGNRNMAHKRIADGNPWRVFPAWPVIDGRCECGDPDCATPGKHPIETLTPNGFNDATSDPSQVNQWWETYPTAIVGYFNGSNGYVPSGGYNALYEWETQAATNPLVEFVEKAKARAAVERDYLTYPADDGGILDAWLDRYGQRWLSSKLTGWLEWAGTHWQAKPDQTLSVEIMRLMVDMRKAAKEAQTEAKSKLELNPAAKQAADAAKAMLQATRRSAARVNSVMTMAGATRYIDPDWLDRADRLNLANGTLDLRTLDLLPHDPNDYLTHCLPYEYDPNAGAPYWQRVLDSIEPATAEFLQEFAGYCLTPSTQYELAVWLHGQPGGGKSTFLAGLQTLLGPKAGLLGLADIERNRFALASLPGKTLVVATEQPASYLASGHILNAIISGEPVMVDRKFKDAVEIQPVAKIAWAMNSLPRISDANSGIFRRVKVVTFPPIPPDQRRPELKAALAGEGAGILNWALAGLQRLRKRGYFVIPESVDAATENFRQTNDVPGVFVAECCVTGPEYRIGGKQLHKAYKDWAIEGGHKPLSITNIAAEWERLGFTKTRINGKSYWEGVKLNEDYDFAM